MITIKIFWVHFYENCPAVKGKNISFIRKIILHHITQTLAFLAFTLFIVWFSAREAIIYYVVSYCNLSWSVWDKCTRYMYTTIILNCHGTQNC
jgi:hypothetical protein